MKKLLTIALAGAIMTTGLVGCGQKEQENQNSETTKTEAVETKTEEKEETEKKEEKSLSEWSGDWNNMGAYLEKEEIQPAYEKIAEKDGGTAEEAKAEYIEKRKTDFDGMNVEGNKITLYDGFKSDGAEEINSSEYKYTGEETTKYGKHDLVWSIYEATSGDAEYKYFLMMPVHGEDGLKHFHFRYGNEDPKDILAKEGWFPTMVDPESTTEQFIEEMTE